MTDLDALARVRTAIADLVRHGEGNRYHDLHRVSEHPPMTLGDARVLLRLLDAPRVRGTASEGYFTGPDDLGFTVDGLEPEKPCPATAIILTDEPETTR